MVDELDPFVAAADTTREAQDTAEAVVLIEVLMFEYQGDAYAVPARCVAGVVPWKAPAPVPGAPPEVRGVIQDRGQIVTVLAEPGGKAAPERADPLRIIVCSTPRGLLGLPASATRAVRTERFGAEPVARTVYDTAGGAYTFIDPSLLVERSAPSSVLSTPKEDS
jgi:chemotaxis signal transduction protein